MEKEPERRAKENTERPTCLAREKPMRMNRPIHNHTPKAGTHNDGFPLFITIILLMKTIFKSYHTLLARWRGRQKY
jgi:hypothetical protein